MLQIFLVFISLTTALCTVEEEVRELNAIANPHEFLLPPEKADMIIDDLFEQYPSLKFSTEDEIIDLKKSFLLFLSMPENQRNEILAGSLSDHPDNELARMLEGLAKYAKEEFDELSDDDQDELESVNNYIWHKLNVQGTLKAIKTKKAEYAQLKTPSEQIMIDIVMQSANIFKSWMKNMDAAEVGEHWKRTMGMDEL